MKYQVRIQPVSKYAPIHSAETIEEIVAWMDANLEWHCTGTDGTWQWRFSQWGKVAVCERQLTTTGTGNWVERMMPSACSDALCRRQNPARK